MLRYASSGGPLPQQDRCTAFVIVIVVVIVILEQKEEKKEGGVRECECEQAEAI